MKFRFNHYNINVMDLDANIKFFQDALGLKIVRTYEPGDNSFKLVYMTDDLGHFQIELTWLADRDEPYDLGDEEFHVAFTVDDFDGAYKKHSEMGCIIYDNTAMGIYFIGSPDGYWFEIVPGK